MGPSQILSERVLDQHSMGRSKLFQTSKNEDSEAEDDDLSKTIEEIENSAAPPMVQSGTVKIDDGGSDLTDRFKYKVQALMGNFDPADTTKDTEKHSGNILSAVMSFPTTYTFHAVGRKDSDDESNEFAETVQRVIREGAGLRDDDDRPEVSIVPRGSKFVKVSVTVTVETGAMVTEIYEQLGALPECVMQF